MRHSALDGQHGKISRDNRHLGAAKNRQRVISARNQPNARLEKTRASICLAGTAWRYASLVGPGISQTIVSLFAPAAQMILAKYIGPATATP
jgi:hypothetical protein